MISEIETKGVEKETFVYTKQFVSEKSSNISNLLSLLFYFQLGLAFSFRPKLLLLSYWCGCNPELLWRNHVHGFAIPNSRATGILNSRAMGDPKASRAHAHARLNRYPRTRCGGDIIIAFVVTLITRIHCTDNSDKATIT